MDATRLVADEGNDGSAVVGDDGRLLYASRALRDLLALQDPTDVERPWVHSLLHPADLQAATELWWSLRPGGPGQLVTLRLRRGDGAYRACRVAVRRLDAAQGDATVVVNVRIGAGRSSLVAALRHEQGRVAAFGRIIAPEQRLLDQVSRALRTPATIVMGAADLLVERYGELTAAQARQLVRSVEEHARRMVTSARSLDVGPVARESLLQREVLDAGATVREVLAEHYAATADVRVDVPPHTDVLVDAGMFRAALRALLDNVVAHTPTGTSVVVTVRSSHAGCELVVDDDGPGIEPGRRDDVFAPSVTHDGVPATGSGLGLHLVDRVAAAHGGAAHVTRRPGGGTRAVLVLPAAEEYALGG